MRELSKYVSMMYRYGQIFYDETLHPYEIGCGQQFFLLRIHEQPGISQYGLAEKGYFDKGTTARAVKKLEELGYITRKIDEQDHRITRLYVTDKGEPIISIIRTMLDDWHNALMDGFSEEEKEMANSLLKRLGENASKTIGRR
ncbi:MarR family winged helix-turn-helix transcriptional regulator [Amedibacillus sp. YH-ame10]